MTVSDLDSKNQTMTRHTFCRLCEVMCGLEITVTNGAVTKVRPDHGHPVSQGFACNKGLLSLDIHNDPDRLARPLRRTEAGWEDASWPDAIGEVASRLRDIIDRHGPNSVAIYFGNPNAFNALSGPAGGLFVQAIGSGMVFSSSTQDCANKFAVGELLYGAADIQPVADIERTDHLLMIGTNPRITKSSFISVPDPVAAMRRVVERGGAVTFVNPLRIEPELGPTVQIRPDTDCYLLAAMLHRIDHTVGFDVERYARQLDGLDALRRWVSDYPPSRVAAVVGVPAETIERLADDFAAAPTAAVHVSTGVNMGRQGALAFYLVQMLSLVTGNFDRPGGNYVRARAFEPMPATAGPGLDSFEATPVGPVRRVKGCLPAALLPEWIRHPEHPIKAFISVAGNPVLSLAGGDVVADAFASLDLLVAIDLYRNATAELAHVVLPSTDWFERHDLNYFTQGVQASPHVQLTEPLVAPRDERKHESEIFSMLIEAMGLPAMLPPGLDGLAMVFDGVLAPHGLSVADLVRRDRGLALLPDDTAGTFFSAQIRTPDRRIDCAPPIIDLAFQRASQVLAEFGAEAPEQLRLITRRTRNTLNSAMSNVAKLMARGADDNPLWIHPDDARVRGISEGGVVRVSNESGSLVARAAFDANLRVGVVSMTHGFGHAAAPGMRVAQAHPGVNVNALSPVGPGTFDPVSGMTHLTGIAVDVTALPC